jgi:hypothetical protein
LQDDIKEWLEQQYGELERHYLPYPKVWRAPTRALKDTPLYALYETFAKAFPDHPSDINTVFYLIESETQRP